MYATADILERLWVLKGYVRFYEFYIGEVSDYSFYKFVVVTIFEVGNVRSAFEG